MALTKWNELKGKGPGYRVQEGDKKEMGNEEKRTGTIIDGTQYDYMKCKIMVDGTVNGNCAGKDEAMPYCFQCPYSDFNKIPESCCCEVENEPKSCLENDIFVTLYSEDTYDLQEKIQLLKRVIRRLERIREQNAKEALIAFLHNYCDEDSCRNCPFTACNNDCLIKMKISALDRKGKEA